MEPSVSIFAPARWYVRAGWIACAGSCVSAACAFLAPYAWISSLLCALTTAFFFWLAARPVICLADTQFNIGERAIAWREIREINLAFSMFVLVLRLRLTNHRKRLLIFPGEPERRNQLLVDLRRHAYLAKIDGVPYAEFWKWNEPEEAPPAVSESEGEQPQAMFTPEDEAEIERMFQTLKSVGHLDVCKEDSPKTTDEA